MGHIKTNNGATNMTLTTIQDAIVPVFVAYTTTDEWGRIGTMIGVYRTEDDAKVAAHKKGWYGSDGRVMMKHAVEDGLDLYVLEGFLPLCYTDVTELREAQRKAKLEAALAKLTPEEIALIKGAK
ncbi:hypothetical protein psageK4_158 [Pseudomonas phage psageK4]|uniref:Uncharacterized protein n=1 Tax=Pseudomonas phage psageK4 TaxID=2859563 RepID=A0ABX8SR30_9CAUD|nr:hypothetical protein QGX14_gp077 [Pseudomonas phage psageK4]QXV71812.1 hypothetical protein psageK4_158 [Pseudomonas phage psageK4]